MALKRKKYWEMERLLGEWYGKERASAEILEFLPKERQIGDIIEDVVKDLVSEDLVLFMKINDSWQELAGKRVARFTKPYKLEEGILIVEVSHPAWLRELQQSFTQILLDKIQKEWGADSCQKISFVPAGRR